MRISEVAKIFDLEIDHKDGGVLRLRAEVILRQDLGNVYEVKLWKREFYRMQPSFPQQSGEAAPERCDEAVLVEQDFLIDTELSRAHTPQVALDNTIQQLRRQFGIP